MQTRNFDWDYVGLPDGVLQLIHLRFYFGDKVWVRAPRGLFRGSSFWLDHQAMHCSCWVVAWHFEIHPCKYISLLLYELDVCFFCRGTYFCWWRWVVVPHAYQSWPLGARLGCFALLPQIQEVLPCGVRLPFFVLKVALLIFLRLLGSAWLCNVDTLTLLILRHFPLVNRLFFAQDWAPPQRVGFFRSSLTYGSHKAHWPDLGGELVIWD